MDGFYDRFTEEHRAQAEEAFSGIVAWGRAQTVFEPGNGTRIAMVLVQVEPHIFGGSLLVALPDFGTSVVTTPGYFHPSYLTEKLNVRGSDADALADFLNAVYAVPA